MVDALVLTRRIGAPAPELAAPCPGGESSGPAGASKPFRLALGAEERSRLRGHRRTVCGRDLLLQLPRGAPLRPGDRLLSSDGSIVVVVEAAAEPLLVVHAVQPLDLLRAAYHLGNRHVALEVRTDELRLPEDDVLADLLLRLGLRVERRLAPFHPETGAYGGGHGHADGHAHGRHEGETRQWAAQGGFGRAEGHGDPDRGPGNAAGGGDGRGEGGGDPCRSS